MSSILTVIDYTSRDYASIQAALQAAIPTYLPEWTSTSDNDFGQVLIQLFAWQADVINYYADRVANESFLATCQQQASAIYIAELVGYTPVGATAASTILSLTLSMSASYPVTLPQGSQFTTTATSTSAAVSFETLQDYVFTADQGGKTVTADSTGANLVVVQGSTVSNESIGTSNGSANQTFSLYSQPVIDGSIMVYVNQGLGPKLWRAVLSLVTAGPTDLVYIITTDANGTTWVTFGDGYNGAIPSVTPTGPQLAGAATAITAAYRVGGGAVSNVGASSTNVPGLGINVDASGTTGLILAVANQYAATGGQDAETVAEIQQNAPQSITAAGRAVSLRDYASLALEVQSVSKAQAVTKAIATGQLYSNITLYVQPSAAPLTIASLSSQVAGLASTIQTYMANSVMVGTTLTILPPQYDGAVGYVPIGVVVIVTAQSQYQSTQIQQDVTSAIDNLFNFSTVSFGQFISLSDLYLAIRNVVGVASCNVTTFCRWEDLTNNNSGTLAGPAEDIYCAAYEIPVVSDPNHPIQLVQVAVQGGS